MMMTTIENPYLDDFGVVERDGGYYVVDTSIQDTRKYPTGEIIVSGFFRNEKDAQTEADKLAHQRWEETG